MKCIPKTLAVMDRIDWIPVDILSNIVIDLADIFNPNKLATEYTSAPFFHLVNPTSVRWSDTYQVLIDDIDSDCELVDWHEWVNRLRASAERGEINENRGIKLLEFCDGMEHGASLATLETTKTAQKSHTMYKLGPVTREWMKLWMRQWKA